MLTEPVKQFSIRVLPGMNNLVDDLDLQDRWVTKAYNCRFEEQPGAIDKRDPVTIFNSESMGEGPVLGLYRFYTSIGIIKFIAAHGTNIYAGEDSTGEMTEIASDLTVGKRMGFETYKDLCIMSNGYDPIMLYDGEGSAAWQLGSCKAELDGVGGDLEAEESYYYAVTFDNDAVVFGAISNTVTTTATEKKIKLSHIPLGPVGTVNRKIYRIAAGGTDLKLVYLMDDNESTTYVDTTADLDLGDSMPPATDQLPKGNILKIHRERLFISGDPLAPNKIYYSNVYLPHFIQQTTNLDYMEISPEDGDEIMGIPIQMGAMICFKKNTIRRLHITSPVSGADPATWYADDPISFLGSPAKWTICQTPYGIVFLGWDHWYLFNGQSTEPIIDEFDTKKILPSLYSDTVGFFYNGIFLAAFSDIEMAEQQHNRIMRYNFKRQALSIDYWTSSFLSGANCFAATTGDNESGELFYGDSLNGYILLQGEAENIYRLRTRRQCLAGGIDNVFVGGTENSPYIEIGTAGANEPIPEGLCIFWEQDKDPGPGWTELKGAEDKLIRISQDTVGSRTPLGVSAETGDDAIVSKALGYRIFYKNSSTTENSLPLNAIVIYDQPFAPSGWKLLGVVGFLEGQGENYPIIHSAFGAGGIGIGGNVENILKVSLIKKMTREEEVWDGADRFVYCLFHRNADPGNGWEDATSIVDLTEEEGNTEVDVINLGTTVHTYTDASTSGGKYHTLNNATAGGLSHDGDTVTAYQKTGTAGADGAMIDIRLTSSHSFPRPVNISEVYYRVRATGNTAPKSTSWPAMTQTLRIEYSTNNGSDWTTLDQYQYSVSGPNGKSYTNAYTLEGTKTDTLTGVTNIRAYTRSYSYASIEAFQGVNAAAFIYELQAKTKYKDLYS